MSIAINATYPYPWPDRLAMDLMMEVQYNGKLYKSNWYTSGDNPEENSGEFQAWTLLGPCGSTATAAPTEVPTPDPTNRPMKLYIAPSKG